MARMIESEIETYGYEPVLRVYKQRCRHYWNIDPIATAEYINAYREYWDSDAQAGRQAMISDR